MVHKIFPGRFESLAGISAFVKLASSHVGFSEFEIYSVETAVDEACSNIIEHAYNSEDQGEIDCTVNPSTDRVEITLKDTGKPFIPKDLKAPDLKCPLSERKNHGLGLYFIYQWMDEVCFSRENEFNVLRMVKIKNSLRNAKN
jgi:serine/threonine-protein kinase RsbW